MSKICTRSRSRGSLGGGRPPSFRIKATPLLKDLPGLLKREKAFSSWDLPGHDAYHPAKRHCRKGAGHDRTDGRSGSVGNGNRGRARLRSVRTSAGNFFGSIFLCLFDREASSRSPPVRLSAPHHPVRCLSKQRKGKWTRLRPRPPPDSARL